MPLSKYGVIKETKVRCDDDCKFKNCSILRFECEDNCRSTTLQLNLSKIEFEHRDPKNICSLV